VIEVVDDTVVDRYFGSDDGNIYEGDGTAASFAASTYDQIKNSFQKENNEDEADWSDIETLFEVLNSEDRTGDPTTWRAELEELFNVDSFLEWLAISAAIGHWDSYGSMSHNYYLYNDPDTGQLSWISWDHNETMTSGVGDSDALTRARGFGGRGVSLDKAEIDDSWPLIRFLLDDPVYYERYLDYLAETMEGAFDADKMAGRYREMAELISPYAEADVGQEAFETSVQGLIDHAYQQANLVEEFLTSIGHDGAD
jgi:spore coat protein CotH